MSHYWDNIYATISNYYQDGGTPDHAEVAKLVGKDDTVLDVACGPGSLAQFLPNNKYLGIDFCKEAIDKARGFFPDKTFGVMDLKDIKKEFKENQFDVVVLRHTLNVVEDWKKLVEDMFWVANKKVIIVNQYPFEENSYLNAMNDDCPDMRWGYNDFNMLARTLSVNVSYGMYENPGRTRDSYFIVIGKHMDDVVFELDDFHETNSNLELLGELHKRFPKMKVTLFVIPSKCSVDWLRTIKRDWWQYAVHGWFHDTEHGTAQECNHWTEEEANKYLDMAEQMGVFEKVFRAPGWNMNVETYRVLIERGYIIAEHLSHDRWEEMGGKRYTTGHLYEVHGHVQNVNMNGLEELATTKCNFSPETNFHFINDDVLGDKFYLPGRYQ